MHGGNMDNKELTAGSTLFLPVWVPGANFSVGDGHGVQGDGEVNLTALETCLTGTFRFTVRKDMKLNNPRGETPTHWITHGFDPDLDDAAKEALRDMIRLIRGKTGRVLGDFVALATVVKGLVLTYGTDLQEDKERVFDAADTLELCLAAMAAMAADLTAQPERMRAACEPGFPTATDLADWVVRVLKKPFREAHHITGRCVKRAEELGVGLDALPLARRGCPRDGTCARWPAGTTLPGCVPRSFHSQHACHPRRHPVAALRVPT